MSKIKVTLLLIAMIVVVCFSGCGNSSIEPTEVPTEAPTEMQVPTETMGYQIPDYTEEEIQAAIDVVREKFDKSSSGCQLLRLEYIEGKYLSDYEYYAKRCAVDRVIVLE